MDARKMIEERHSVRSYKQAAIEPEKVQVIREEIYKLNDESGLHIQYIDRANGVFGGLMQKFAGCWIKSAGAASVRPVSGLAWRMSRLSIIGV